MLEWLSIQIQFKLPHRAHLKMVTHNLFNVQVMSTTHCMAIKIQLAAFRVTALAIAIQVHLLPVPLLPHVLRGHISTMTIIINAQAVVSKRILFIFVSIIDFCHQFIQIYGMFNIQVATIIVSIAIEIWPAVIVCQWNMPNLQSMATKLISIAVSKALDMLIAIQVSSHCTRC